MSVVKKSRFSLSPSPATTTPLKSRCFGKVEEELREERCQVMIFEGQDFLEVTYGRLDLQTSTETRHSGSVRSLPSYPHQH
jgi:hypothetical protein